MSSAGETTAYAGTTLNHGWLYSGNSLPLSGKNSNMRIKRARILMGRLGKGYEHALKKLSTAFSEAGFEVIYTELDDPVSIVTAALQEGADHIGITILPEADINVFSKMVDLLILEQSSYISISAGGFLGEDEIPLVKSMGVSEFFPIGTTYAELIRWAKDNIKPSAI